MNFFKYFLEYQHIKLGKMPLMEKGPSCRDIVYKIKQLNDLIKTVLVLASKQYLPKNIWNGYIFVDAKFKRIWGS